jgi:PAT family beta-lactamase induction signal transducer AmpG
MLAIALMGFASGLPFPLTAGTLMYRLSEAGLSKTEIGLFALAALPYALKFLWAPAVDELRLPGLAALGQRRSWILGAQLGLVAAFLGLGLSDPVAQPLATAGWAFAVAFLSATQDVAVDAYRIEVLEPHEQGAGAAATQTGYRLAMLCSAAGALALSDHVAWPVVFGALAALLGLGMLGVAIGPEPPASREVSGRERLAARMRRAIVEPLRDLATLPNFAAILAFAVLYKYGDSVAGVMANPFYRELGFTGTEIASASQVPGLAASIAGVVAGGWLVARLGVLRALVWGGIAQAATNLMFVALALAGRDLSLLVAAVVVDSFAGGLASSAFVAFLSGLCRPGAAATQYAVLTSLMAVGRTGLSGASGWLADQLGWPAFFAATTGLAAPGLLLLWWLSTRRAAAAATGKGRQG